MFPILVFVIFGKKHTKLHSFRRCFTRKGGYAISMVYRLDFGGTSVITHLIRLIADSGINRKTVYIRYKAVCFTVISSFWRIRIISYVANSWKENVLLTVHPSRTKLRPVSTAEDIFLVGPFLRKPLHSGYVVEHLLYSLIKQKCEYN